MIEPIEYKPLTHRIEGEGEPVLLLNGGLMSIAAWEPVATALTRHYKVIRCDLRGQLLTPGEPEPKLEPHVADVIDLLDRLGLDRIHLAGTSYGSFVAIRLAALHPERVASVSVIAGTERITPEAWAGTERLREIALEAINGGDGGKVLEALLPGTYSPEYLEAQKTALAFHKTWVRSMPTIFFKGFVSMLSSMEGLDLTPDLGAVRCPVLIVAPELDKVFPLERSQAMAAGIPNARLEIVPGAPHGIVVERADDTARLLLDFLATLATDTTGASNA
ncbi:MAG TPA: alpha/beta hydrolase [Thermoanaerobaculia bacterium]|nr:alpha/beta hydrolase [Thermoanaerobaculia bacterium]